MLGLKNLLAKAIGHADKKEEDLLNVDGQMHYKPLDLETVYVGYNPMEVWELTGTAKLLVADYCHSHHIAPVDLARVGATILLGDCHNTQRLSNPKIPLVIFLPIFRGGALVAGWGRVFNETKTDGKPWKWRGYGFSDGNGAILYTTALPLAAFAMTEEKAEKTPVVLVESPTDAIRLQRLGWWAVALGGHTITQKGREELARMPQKSVIVLLDSDAKNATLSLVAKVQAFKKKVVPVFIHSKGESYIVDPSDLDDHDLRGFLLKPIQELING